MDDEDSTAAVELGCAGAAKAKVMAGIKRGVALDAVAAACASDGM
jgi:hypothetical protein